MCGRPECENAGAEPIAQPEHQSLQPHGILLPIPAQQLLASQSAATYLVAEHVQVGWLRAPECATLV